MKAKTLKYYEWDDIKNFLCEKLMIKEYEFSGIYWDIYSRRFDPQGGYERVIIDDNNMESYIKRYGLSAIALGTALDALRDELGTYELYIFYDW